MPHITFRDRIALYYSITTALLVAVVFITIYFTVRDAVYQDLDHDLSTEAAVLLKEIVVDETHFSIAAEEWKEQEHITVDINPLFVQFMNSGGEIFATSPNMKSATLSIKKNGYSNSSLNGASVRQYQFTVSNKERPVGHIIIAAPMDEALQLVFNLERVLFIAYPVILVILFSVARILAGRSIQPVKEIIVTSKKITRENLSQRIPLPDNRDELYVLSETINDLVARIESAVEREKQFTSDASHELRTPLAVVKGTLEVLKRKPRSREEYEEKIDFCLKELDRINRLVDQLLLLARFESQTHMLKRELVNINALFFEVTSRYSQSITEKDIKIDLAMADEVNIRTDEYLLSIIIDNLIGNAIKYTEKGKHLKLSAGHRDTSFIVIQDSGIGMAELEVEKVFRAFYRSKDAAFPDPGGSGIGLSIVKRLCDLLGIQIDIRSKKGEGTRVVLHFPVEESSSKDNDAALLT